MPDQVLVFSIDGVRGGIAQKILERKGFKVLLFGKILALGKFLAEQSPKVVILDTYRCIAEEIKQIKNLCQTLPGTRVILLGEPATILGFNGAGPDKDLCLSGPLDADLIIAKVKEVFSSKVNEKRAGTGTLEDDLKNFLKLD